MNKLFTFARETSLGRSLIVIGLILAAFGTITLVFAKDTGNYIKTDAVVTRADLVEEEHDDKDTDTHHDAVYNLYVKYSANGNEYEKEYGEFSGYREGDHVTICFDPENPEEIAQPGSRKLFSLAFIAAGAAALAGGIASLANAYKKHKQLKLQEEEWKHGK